MSNETANNQGRVGSETARELAEQLAQIYQRQDGHYQRTAKMAELLEAHDAQLVADLTKPSPREKPGHRMADCRPATLADNSENEFVCTLCEREEREKALAVGAALEYPAALIKRAAAMLGMLAPDVRRGFKTVNEFAAELSNFRIPEASKKALADERERLLADFEALVVALDNGCTCEVAPSMRADPKDEKHREYCQLSIRDRLRAAIARYKAQGGASQDGPDASH